MSRNHFDFSLILLDNSAIGRCIFGMRSSSTVTVYVDVRKMIEADMELLESANGALLTGGDVNVRVPPQFSSHAVWLGPPETTIFNSYGDWTERTRHRVEGFDLKCRNHEPLVIDLTEEPSSRRRRFA